MAVHRMAPVDAAWLHMDRPSNEVVVTAVLWFDGRLDGAVVHDAITSRLVGRHPRFAQRVHDSGRRAWWVDVADFDPMTHVVREQLAAPGGLAQLTARVTELAAQPLARDAPLWRIHIVDGYLGGTALVARIHHCLADGVALFRVLLALSDEAGRAAQPLPAATAGRPATRFGSAVGRVASALATLALLPPDRRTGLRRTPGGTKTVCWSEPMPLQPIKQAARDAGATVNDVVLAALGDALHRYLRDTDGVARDVRAVLPVNLRALDSGGDPLGNRFGLIFLRLPTATSDGAERLAVIRRRTARLKASAVPLVALQILRVAGRLPQRIVQLLITLFSMKASLVVTNVPGPTVPLHLGGHRLDGIVAWPPQVGSLGGGVAVISYAGTVCVGVMSDDAVVPDPQVLLGDLTVALLELGPVAPERTHVTRPAQT